AVVRPAAAAVRQAPARPVVAGQAGGGGTLLVCVRLRARAGGAGASTTGKGALMNRQKRLTDGEVMELERRMERALETFHDFLGAVRDQPELAEPLRARAAEGMESLAAVRRDWPRVAEDWRQLRGQIGELRQ